MRTNNRFCKVKLLFSDYAKSVLYQIRSAGSQQTFPSPELGHWGIE